MIVDLSHPLHSGMPVFPGDPEVWVQPAAEIERDGFAVARLELGSHSGTHVDAPAHSIAGGRTIDEVGLDELHGPAVVLQVEGLSSGDVITAEHLAPLLGDRFGGARIVLLATGWDTHWGTDKYFAHPTLSREACEVLIDAGMHVLGVDTLNPDPSDGSTLEVHELLLGNDHLIVENLRGLTTLPREVHFTGVPLRIDSGDGSPIRAFATHA